MHFVGAEVERTVTDAVDAADVIVPAVAVRVAAVAGVDEGRRGRRRTIIAQALGGVGGVDEDRVAGDGALIIVACVQGNVSAVVNDGVRIGKTCPAKIAGVPRNDRVVNVHSRRCTGIGADARCLDTDSAGIIVDVAVVDNGDVAYVYRIGSRVVSLRNNGARVESRIRPHVHDVIVVCKQTVLDRQRVVHLRTNDREARRTGHHTCVFTENRVLDRHGCGQGGGDDDVVQIVPEGYAIHFERPVLQRQRALQGGARIKALHDDVFDRQRLAGCIEENATVVRRRGHVAGVGAGDRDVGDAVAIHVAVDREALSRRRQGAWGGCRGSAAQ